MVTGAGDELAAAAAGRGRPRVSHADREQVIGTLKAAFAHGMLAKDEFDLRVSQAFASQTDAELAAVTADLPAEPTAAQPPRPARMQDRIMQRPGRMMVVATALYAGVLAFVFLPPWPSGNSDGDPPQPIPVLFVLSNLTYLFVLLFGVVNMVELRREKRSGGRPLRQPAPGAGGQASPRLPSADPGGQLPPTGHGHQHTAEAERSHPPRPPRRARGHRGDGAPTG